MAYLDDHTHNHKRIAGLSGVAAVHLVLAFGLATGLTITGFKKEKDEPIPTVFIDMPTPTPTRTPEAQPTESVTRTLPTVPDRAIDITRNHPFETTIDFPDRDIVELVVPSVPDIGPITMPTTMPTVAPKSAVPRNGPTGWVTNADYPRRGITQGLEGDVTYMLDVGLNGRATACRIVSSSGHSVLDQATCRLIERRARFDPATDRTGAQVAGTYRGAVSWTIPD
ncbi:energy transducer TonB [Altererythrobacter sp. KTW20L]|uniref:energy transducer TonB n=1 Tax=Altererythrobacter sp. KTW20L TaxID=2942210 RepID=UPI0020C038AD|nr:energy transducer TonB [Altererythrobacter sp. KTW20L]MCL6249569.1 energy transducer TonB [Altererythrobacter sp. KTW20L]